MLLAVLLRGPYLQLPLGWDEIVWAYIAMWLAKGDFLPYRDVVDN